MSRKRISMKSVALVLLSAWLALYGSHIVVATSDDDYRAAVYDTVYFDLNNYDSCTATAGGNTPLTGSGNEDMAFNYLVGKGLTPKQAAGIIGNLLWESGLDPKRLQGAGHQQADAPKSGIGYGIAQWTPSDRQTGLKNAAIAAKLPVYDLSVQLNYLWKEATSSSPFDKSISAVKATTTIDAAVRAFEKEFERANAAKANIPARIGLGNDAYGRYISKHPAGSTPTAPTTDTTAPAGGCGAAGGGNGDVVSVAKAELAKGVKENPIGCDSGNNSSAGSCGAEVDKYTDNHLEYWCADFVSWVYKQAGKPFTGGTSGGWRIPSTVALATWLQKGGNLTINGPSANPKPGDLYFITDGGLAGIHHVGIVEKVVGNTLYTISGNTSIANYSNGVGVGAGTYANFRSQSRIYAFGSPQ
jgi:hypothetical protein